MLVGLGFIWIVRIVIYGSARPILNGIEFNVSLFYHNLGKIRDMADYCQECSEELFGKDFGDFSGITTEEHIKEDRAALVLCEGCGPIFVDPQGKCMCSDCDKGHIYEQAATEL